MSLGDKQREFTLCVSKLIAFAYSNGFELTFGDAYRDPKVHGEFGAKESYSHRNSVHKLRLAVDFNLFINGKYITDGSCGEYKLLGEYWEEMHEDARWGGRFIPNDSNHFSFTHWGAM